MQENRTACKWTDYVDESFQNGYGPSRAGDTTLLGIRSDEFTEVTLRALHTDSSSTATVDPEKLCRSLKIKEKPELGIEVEAFVKIRTVREPCRTGNIIHLPARIRSWSNMLKLKREIYNILLSSVKLFYVGHRRC